MKVIENDFSCKNNSSSSKIRSPRQKRSIETKNKILESSFELFARDGYYSTNTAEIAKNANVSTGIVYGYFKDKRDILLDVADIYMQKVSEPFFKIIDKLEIDFNIEKLIDDFIQNAKKVHKKYAHIHEALHSMTHTDEEINRKFIAFEDNISKKLYDKLIDLNFENKDLKEKIHLAINIIQSFSHENEYDKHSYINYYTLENMVKDTILQLFV